MSGSGRRPDLVGTAFGAFVVFAIIAVVARLLWPAGDDGQARGFARILPGFGGAVAADHDTAGSTRAGWRAGGRGGARAQAPLFYDGPREVTPAADHEPAELRLPSLGVRTPLLRLGKRADGTMEVPGDFSLAGWYVRGPAPGQAGPAVVAGHLDSRRGPAVFARLGELAPGDEILVTRGDGHVVRFTVRRTASYPKDAFPTDEVYGDTDGAELRLITCDGDFDRGSRSYEENLVVYAVADPATLPADPGPAVPRETPRPEPSDTSSGPSASPAPGSPSPSPSPSPSGATPSESPSGAATPSESPSASPSPEPRPSPTGLPTEEPSPTPRPSGGVRLP